MSEHTNETVARPDGCACADIAEVVGSRLTDGQIVVLCDLLRASVTSPGEQAAR